MPQSQTANPMGSAPIPKLLWKNSIPLIFSLLAHSLYNFVDSVFVSHVSEAALTALSLAAPVQGIMGALGCGIAVGLNAAISKAMGEQDTEKVRQTASASMLLAIGAWVLICIACLVGLKPYYIWQSAGNAAIYEAGVAYLRVCMLFSLGTMFQWVFDRFLIATGKSTLFLFTLTVASVVNLVLDPIFIFGWLGLPAMGTTGAAIATVIGQFCGAIAGWWANARHNREIPLHFTLRVPMERFVNILRVGIPTTVMQSVVALTGVLMNTILQGFSTTAIAVMGVCNRVAHMATLPPHGIDNALIPIIAYNYGAKNKERITQAIRWAHIYSFGMMAVIMLALEIFPAPILALFDASEEMMSMGIPAIRILSVSYFLSVPGLVLSTAFQALGLGSYSMILTLSRQVVLPLGLGLALAQLGNLNYVWSAFLLAEVIAIPLALVLFGRAKKAVLEKI